MRRRLLGALVGALLLAGCSTGEGAVESARDAARGHAAVCVSHQLPIWTLRLHLEGRRYAHDPRRRQCGLASVTSLTYDGERFVSLAYAEPAGATDPDAVPGA